MAAPRSCSRPAPLFGPPLFAARRRPPDPLRHLGPDGPLHPESFPVLTPSDAFEALDLSRRDAFIDGLIVLLLDDQSYPIVAMAIDNAPPDDLTAVSQILIAANQEGHRIASVILGVVRESPLTDPAKVRVARNAMSIAAWHAMSCELHANGVTLLDIVIIEPRYWMSLVASNGDEFYSSQPFDRSPR